MINPENLKPIIFIALLFFSQCTSTSEKKEFAYNNSKDIEKLNSIYPSNSNLKGLTNVDVIKDYNFDSILVKTFEMASCKLPNKIAKKIKDDGGLLPPKVKEFFYGNPSQFPKKIYRLPGIGKGIEYLMHLVDIQKGQRVNQQIQYKYKNYALDFEGFILSKFIAEKSSNLFYTLDCQGYFNAALAIHGTSMFSNIKSEAASNLNEKSTTMIGYAPVVNPFAQAFYNNLPGVKKLNTQERLMILRKLLDISDLEDSDIITYMTAVNCLFITKSNENNLNGNVNLDLDIRTPVVGTGLSAGIELSKSIKFQVFDTYYIKDELYSDRDKFSYKDLKAKISELELASSNANNQVNKTTTNQPLTP